MISKFYLFAVFSLLIGSNWLTAAETVVDHSVAMETIKTDFGLCDGPAWDAGSLFVPDVKDQKLYRYWPKQNRWQALPIEPSRFSASFFQLGQLYLSDNGNSRIVRLDGNQLTPLCTHADDLKPPAKPNDLVVDHDGGLYYTVTPRNEVRYLAAGAGESVVVAEVTTPNGIILSPDEQTLYVSAYVPKEVWAYPVKQAGVLGTGTVLARMDDGPDKGADGMCVDRAGNIYCCGPADVWIWNPAGELLEKLPVPTRPINCTFGDNEHQSLYITGFGGLYRQQMKISGRSSEPPRLAELQPEQENRPETTVAAGLELRADLVYAEYGTRKLLADVVLPESQQNPLRPAVIVVHGGGWLKGDKSKFRAMALELARRGYVAMSIEYRLGGEAPFPAAIHDCMAAVRFLRAHAAEYQIDPEKIGVVGGSAGGHLAGLLAAGWDIQELQGKGGWAEYSSRPNAAIVLAGPLEMTSGSVAERSRTQGEKSNSNLWLQGTIDEKPELYQLADAYQKISADDPPIAFLVGEKDQPERNAAARKKLEQLGIPTKLVVYPNAVHGCWNQKPWLEQYANDIDLFLQSQF